VRTGPDLHEKRALRDGTHVILRHIRPEDAAELRRAFDRLSPESRYRRFFGGVPHLTDASLRYLTEVDGRDHVALVATTDGPDAESPTGLGVARFIRLPGDPTVAEAAVTVVDDFQRKGLGRLLATTLAEAARERGIGSFRADVLADNEPMRAIMREIGAVEREVSAGVVTYDVPLDAAESAPGPVDRILRAAAGSMSVLHRRLSPGRQ
jgi:GNAT superfamily N-acetyltransferase